VVSKRGELRFAVPETIILRLPKLRSIKLLLFLTKRLCLVLFRYKYKRFASQLPAALFAQEFDLHNLLPPAKIPIPIASGMSATMKSGRKNPNAKVIKSSIAAII